jgi:hypothetical protein
MFLAPVDNAAQRSSAAGHHRPGGTAGDGLECVPGLGALRGAPQDVLGADHPTLCADLMQRKYRS